MGNQGDPWKVTFLFDPDNNWIEQHITSSGLLDDIGHFDLVFSQEASEVHGQDVVFILGYTKILPDSFLEGNKLNLVVHESDLPQGKGFAPVQWQILEGRNEIPICLIEALPEVDSGDILLKDCISLDGTELYDEIRKAQAQATLRLITRFLDLYPEFERQPQSGGESFYPRRLPADGELDINLPLKDQFNLLRIGNNDAWPSYFIHMGVKYVLRIEKFSPDKQEP